MVPKYILSTHEYGVAIGKLDGGADLVLLSLPDLADGVSLPGDAALVLGAPGDGVQAVVELDAPLEARIHGHVLAVVLDPDAAVAFVRHLQPGGLVVADLVA